ncbi:hypothetical protein DFH08DRAFT_805507 [Mycena albidolilacea]|uniref:Tyr recombinase domain-containing protein n=1 Tax=Mycena albidolilacea TaxID=1033008 RepID=A0AAD7A8Q4_9AGAR|nr:hypothetical protein DFH08DRAFT_805507 [Mycena albidolilacea]
MGDGHILAHFLARTDRETRYMGMHSESAAGNRKFDTIFFALGSAASPIGDDQSSETIVLLLDGRPPPRDVRVAHQQLSPYLCYSAVLLLDAPLARLRIAVKESSRIFSIRPFLRLAGLFQGIQNLLVSQPRVVFSRVLAPKVVFAPESLPLFYEKLPWDVVRKMDIRWVRYLRGIEIKLLAIQQDNSQIAGISSIGTVVPGARMSAVLGRCSRAADGTRSWIEPEVELRTHRDAGFHSGHLSAHAFQFALDPAQTNIGHPSILKHSYLYPQLGDHIRNPGIHLDKWCRNRGLAIGTLSLRGLCKSALGHGKHKISDIKVLYPVYRHGNFAENVRGTSQSIGNEAIQAENKEEVESMLSGLQLDQRNSLREARTTDRSPESPSKVAKTAKEEMSKHLKLASENIVVDNTRAEYRRLWNQFISFCVEIGCFLSTESPDKLFKKSSAEVPTWIALWIINKCDDSDIKTGKLKDPGIARATYSTAQKMCAAMSHKFSCNYELGTQEWQENLLVPGQFYGNPSTSTVVSQYMISLRRNKVRGGEVVTSACAMDEPTMKKLWTYNTGFPVESSTSYGLTSKKRKQEHPEDWAGHSIRMMLQLLYIVLMLCLLRYDEALRITWQDVTFDMETGVLRIRLDLPFRKTHQNGGITPFYLYANPDRPWMCPVHAFAIMWKLAVANDPYGKPSGFIFRKKVGRNGWSIIPSEGMSTDSFIEYFRNNLLDIDIDPHPYGTHSFRQGGCQYLAMALHWPFCNICSWGGWAENFDNPGTLFKYLLSWTDTPLLEREDYLNPSRPFTCSRVNIPKYLRSEDIPIFPPA